MTGLAALFGTLRIPIASEEALYCSFLDLDAINRAAIAQVGVEGWTFDFLCEQLRGCLGRAYICFVTTHALLEPLVFPKVFAAL